MARQAKNSGHISKPIWIIADHASKGINWIWRSRNYCVPVVAVAQHRMSSCRKSRRKFRDPNKYGRQKHSFFQRPPALVKTIVKHPASKQSNLGFSISALTRSPRPYGGTRQRLLLSPEEFKKRIDADEFIEWEESLRRKFLRYAEVWDSTNLGWRQNVIFDVDVKGWHQPESTSAIKPFLFC